MTHLVFTTGGTRRGPSRTAASPVALLLREQQRLLDADLFFKKARAASLSLHHGDSAHYQALMAWIPASAASRRGLPR